MFFALKVNKINKNPYKKAKFSVSEILYHLINLIDAKNNLSEEDYCNVRILFDVYSQLKDKNLLDLDGYLDTSTRLIASFDMLAPCYCFSGNQKSKFLFKTLEEGKQDYREKAKELFKTIDVNSLEWWEQFNEIFQDFKARYYD